ncbi:MAG TPA: FAD-dependent oxidoreductase [Actinomycetota bacterium]|nr:FAD-dependent oxidoreductase [Actinomycetota bacterium]
MAEITIYGAAWCPECRRTKRLLGEVRVDFDWVDLDVDPSAEGYVRRHDSGKLTLPLVVLEGGKALVAPSGAELLEALGVEQPRDRRFFDVIVIGAGPAGLTAALGAVREGMHCLVIEQGEPGGQASATPRVHGIPGFAEGASGAEVKEGLLGQARRYGIRILAGQGLKELSRIDGYLLAVTGDGEEFVSRSAVIATGVSYAELGFPGEDQLRGAGLHSCASCEGPFYRKAEELLVVGGGDLAGEEALFLTQFAGKVRVLAESAEFKTSPVMLERLRRNPKIELYPSTEVAELSIGSDGKLTAAVVRDRTTGYTFSFNPTAVFAYPAMTPNTDALVGAVDLDPVGFVMTDGMLETSMPGVFAAGDVRAGSTKQLGSAIGEGMTAVVMVRYFLEQLGDLAPRAPA